MNRFNDAPDFGDACPSSVIPIPTIMPEATASSSLSSSLLARARENDPRAWTRLCRIALPLVYGWCRRASLQDSDALDIGQEVFHVVTLRLGTFRQGLHAGGFRAWLWGITNNKLKEHFRRQVDLPGDNLSRAASQCLQELEVAIPASFSDEQADGRNAVLLRRVLDLLRTDFDEQTFQAFWRCTVDGQASKSVAVELKMTAGAVRQAKCRVMRRLRDELDDLL